MRTFHSPINLYLNQRGSRESHKPLHLSNEPKIHGLCHSLYTAPWCYRLSFARKQFPNAVIGAIHTLMRKTDWCDIPTLNAVIGARYPNAVIWLVRDTYPYAAIWLVRDKYPNAANWLVRATYHSKLTLLESYFFLPKKKIKKEIFDSLVNEILPNSFAKKLIVKLCAQRSC